VAAASGLAVAGSLAGAAAASGAPAHLAPVVFNYWHGRHWSSHFYGAVRPRVLGDSFGEPLNALRWQAWNSGSAAGRGEIIHMSCQPCRVAVRLSGATRSHGWLYYRTERVTYLRGGGTVTLHWSWRARNYV
jgi:hypothetical protein